MEEIKLDILTILYEQKPYRVIRHLKHIDKVNFYPMFLGSENMWTYFDVPSNQLEWVNFSTIDAAIEFVTPTSSAFLAGWKDASESLFFTPNKMFRDSILSQS